METIVVDGAHRVLFTSQAQLITSAAELPYEMASAWELAAAPSGNPFHMWLYGRFVEAERANLNGAFWSTQDLEVGEPTVRNGPLNMLHNNRHIIGTITDGRLIRPPVEEARQTVAQRPHIATTAVVWKHIYPHEARVIEAAANAGKLHFSMECRAEKIRCETSSDGARQGCGKEYEFAQVYGQDTSSVCDHLRRRTSQRHMINPTFIGGAIIVPPARPGWADANADLHQEAADLAERTFEAAGEYSAADWEAIMLVVMQMGDAL